MKKIVLIIAILASTIATAQLGIGTGKITKVKNLNSALKGCAHDNGYTDEVLLTSILTLDCVIPPFLIVSKNRKYFVPSNSRPSGLAGVLDGISR